MSAEEKNIEVINLNLFSGSSDRLRTAMGGFFYIFSGSATGEYVDFQLLQNIIGGPSATGVNPAIGSLSPYLYKMGRGSVDDYPLTEVVENDSLTLTWRYPVRFTGLTDTIYDENFWKTYWVGGTFGEETYPGLYSETTYTDCWFAQSLPYTKEEKNVLEGAGNVTNEIEISYNYNFYLQEYQTYVNSLSSELLIPNMYTITMFMGGNAASTAANLDGLLTEEDWLDTRAYDKNILNFVSLENTWPANDSDDGIASLSDLLSDADYLINLINGTTNEDGDGGNAQVSGRGTGRVHVIGPYGDTTCKLYDFHLHEYLSGSVPLSSLSSSTVDYVNNALENVMFDQESFGGGNIYSTLKYTDTRWHTSFPYYTKIRFSARNDSFVDKATTTDYSATPTYADGFPVAFAEALVENNYSSKFLKSLKEAFNEEADEVSVTPQEYVLAENYYSSSQDLTYDTIVKVANNTALRTIDFFDLWTYSYENYDSQTDNCYFVGEKTISRESAMDTTGTYRYFNSEGALGFLGQTLQNIGPNADVSGLAIYNEDIDAKELYNGWRGDDTGKYNETIAYRIEKIGGPTTGDSSTQNVLQNFWIFNSTEFTYDDDVTLFDTQIKYGEDYTYNIYKYVIVVGTRYKLSDLSLSRPTNFNTTSEDYCIEFYDPYTGDLVDSVYELASSAVTVTDPYLADLMVTIEPDIKIFEIPITTKTLKILDHPPNQLNLNPFFFLDESQIIGYNVNYETFVEETYPDGVSSEDEERRQAYLNANDMIDDGKISLESRSQQRYIEVYRLSEKPTSYEDFDNNLISTIDLKIEDSIYTLPSTIFYDKINTNQKYYYLFRILNENRVPGQLSEIYEAELINDGGYTYAMFELLFEQDLQTDNFITPSVSFKKLIQLQPNMSQIDFNDAEVDYSDSATNQLGNMSLSTADDPIWDKTFKIRLTSKKTGKKMDLNVTYKYDINSN